MIVDERLSRIFFIFHCNAACIFKIAQHLKGLLFVKPSYKCSNGRCLLKIPSHDFAQDFQSYNNYINFPIDAGG